MAPDEDLRRFQEHLLHQTLVAAFVLGVVGATFSMARAFETGLHPAPLMHVATLVVLAWALLTLRRRSYRCLLAILLGSLVLDGIVGFLSYGIASSGFVFFATAGMLAAVFAGRWLSIAILGLGAVTGLAFTALFTTAGLALPLDLDVYNTHLSSWMAKHMILVFFAGILLVVIVGLFDRMRTHLHEISTLNASLEDRVASRTAALVASNREKDRILGIVAHDLNNKLFGIIGHLELLKARYPSLDDEGRLQLLEPALQSSLYAEDIVKELRTSPRLDADAEAELATETVDLAAFASATLEAFRPLAAKKGVSLHVDASDAPAVCPINRAAFSRVTDNLITNAIKFTPSGGSVTLSIAPVDEGILLTVRDTGIGIPADLQPKVFSTVAAVSRPGTAGEASTGLGLSIAKRIVELHGGALWFESREGEGSAFHVRLPR